MPDFELPDPSELSSYAKLVNRQANQASGLPECTDPQAYLQTLDYHGISLLALQQQTLTAEVSGLLQQRKAMMVANEVIKQKALQELFQAFEQAGLKRIVLFKGAALAYTVYDKPWLRPRSDSDCLIDGAQFQEFSRVFADLGYHKLFAIEGRHIHYQATFSKALAGQTAINIDLHWRINNRKIFAQTYNVDQLLNDGHSLPVISPAITVPAAEDSLLIASLHRLGHHVREERLIWLYDIHLLATSLQDSQWRALCDKAQQKKLAGITLDALSACIRLFDTSVPGQFIDQLSQNALRAESSQLFLKRDLPEWRYFLEDLKALPGIWPKVLTIWQNLVPSPAYVRRQMDTKSALVGYCKRMIRGFKRILGS